MVVQTKISMGIGSKEEGQVWVHIWCCNIITEITYLEHSSFYPAAETVLSRVSVLRALDRV